MIARVMMRAVGAGLAALVVIGGAPDFHSAQAEDPIPTELNTADVPGYIGTWRITMDLMGNEMSMFLNVVDVDGHVGATLDSERQPEPLAISQIELTDEGLDMNSEFTFGGSFKIDINIKVRLEGEGLIGTIRDQGGIFSSELVGVKATVEELDAVQGGRPAPTEARMNIGGKRVRIAFADLEVGTSDWDLFQTVAEGQVFKFTLSRATKMYTDFDLGFGDVVIEKENMAKDYPGVYSMWLKKTGSGWALVFNDQPDIWGTRYEPEHDVAEVPLNMSKIDGEPQEKFLVKLERNGETGTLQLLWGDTQWSADFAITQ